jgi:hypothetical protein
VKPESLRSEFILTGGATLLSLYLLVVSIQRRRRASCFFHGKIMKTCTVHPFTVPEQLKSSGVAVVAIAILIGLAFIVGIIVVQITFFIPTEGLIHVRRQRRLCELRCLDRELRKQYEPRCDSHLTILTKVFKESRTTFEHGSFVEFVLFYLRKIFRRPIPLSTDESLMLNIGRQLAPDAVIREYEYRRSNRQIFVGVLPAFAIVVSAAIVNPWSSQARIQDIIEFAAAIIGLAMISALFASANYQERVAQAQLLDTAFAALWSQFTDQVTVEPKPLTNRRRRP